MLGNVYELFAASRLLIIVHPESAFEVFDRSTKNIACVVFPLQHFKKGTSENWLVMLLSLLTNSHKVTIDLYNFLEIFMKVYLKVDEIRSNAEFSGI